MGQITRVSDTRSLDALAEKAVGSGQGTQHVPRCVTAQRY